MFTHRCRFKLLCRTPLAGGEIMHVDMNVFSAKDWKLSWLLLLPFVNYAKDWVRCASCHNSCTAGITISPMYP
jgi:hypothetical protein